MGNGQGGNLIGAEWDEQIPTWPLLLQKSGYHLGYTYKVWSPGNPRDAGIGGHANKYGGGGSTGFHNMFRAGLEKWRGTEDR